MRWLTVNVPGEPEREILPERPGPPSLDEATAEQVRDLVTKGAMGGTLFFRTDDAHTTHAELQRKGRRAHRGADRAPLRHRLRPPHPFGNAIRIAQRPPA